MIRCLQKAALNGATGQIVGVDAELDRYRVQLTGQGADGKPIKVKPENVFLDAMAYGIPSST